MITSGDDVAFLRTVNMPSRKIGKAKIDALRTLAEQNGTALYDELKKNIDTPLFAGTGARAYVEAIETLRASYTALPLGTLLQAVMDRSGYEAYLRLQNDQDRLDNVAEFRRAVEKAGQDDDANLEDFLAHIALFTDLDREENRSNVKLMTIHAAKGMEFPYVFVCGLNEGVFPSRKTLSLDDMEEERRIAYVAMTRAKDALFLSDAEGTANDNLFKQPSRFIFDAGLENLTRERELDESLVVQTKTLIDYSEAQLKRIGTPYEEGTRVRHPIFGSGTVVSVNKKAGCYGIAFDSMQTERSIRFGAELSEEG